MGSLSKPSPASPSCDTQTWDTSGPNSVEHYPTHNLGAYIFVYPCLISVVQVTPSLYDAVIVYFDSSPDSNPILSAREPL